MTFFANVKCCMIYIYVVQCQCHLRHCICNRNWWSAFGLIVSCNVPDYSDVNIFHYCIFLYVWVLVIPMLCYIICRHIIYCLFNTMRQCECWHVIALRYTTNGTIYATERAPVIHTLCNLACGFVMCTGAVSRAFIDFAEHRNFLDTLFKHFYVTKKYELWSLMVMIWNIFEWLQMIIIIFTQANFGLRVLSSPASVCVYLCVSVCVSLCVNHLQSAQ